MGAFKRGFGDGTSGEAKWNALDALAKAGGNWWTDLLSRWVPSGQEAGSHGLRLAVRDGYLNFYRLGQSVARVCFGPRGANGVEARMEIHAKYVWDNTAPDSYAQLRGGILTCTGREPMEYRSIASCSDPGQSSLHGWITRCKDWSGEEKMGVDRVVGNNPTVIDLEMGMPAWGDVKTALRVDIAALDITDGTPRLVLWEAKPLDSDALRRSGDDSDAHEGNPRAPKIIKQMNDYRKYLNAPSHDGMIGKAYIANCRALVRLAKMAGKSVILHQSIHDVAKADHLEVAAEPRLALFQGVRKKDGTLVGYSRGTWPAHRDKLRRHNILIVENDDPASLLLHATLQ